MARLTLAVFATLAAAAWAPLGAAPQAFAQPVQIQHDLAAPARRAVNQVVYASTSTSAAAERALDARLNEQRRAIEALRGRLTQAGGRNETLAAELSVAQERYCATLAERDRAYAQEIAVLRGAAEDIAATPEGLAALERFNAGDELGALVALDRLRDARERARQVRNNIESAAEGRDIATLALEARNRGRLDTAAVIARYAEVTRLDPGVHWDWVELGRLYVDAGDLSEARRAAERAAQTAQSQLDRAIAHESLGDVNVAQGDLTSAQREYEERLRLIAQLAESSPRDSALQEQLSVSFAKLGELMHRLRNFPGAADHFARALAIDRRLAADNPDDIRHTRSVALDLGSLGLVSFSQFDYANAHLLFAESLTILEQLWAGVPDNSGLLRDIIVSLQWYGDVLATEGDFVAAQAALVRCVEFASRRAETDPGNAVARRDLGICWGKMGNAALAQGDLQAAQSAYRERLRILAILSATDPTNADLQRDQFMTYANLGTASGDHNHFARALELAVGLQSRGQLAPADQWMIEELERRVSQGDASP